jgi:hypothetical protein
MGWVVSVTPRPRFTPGERTTDTHCTGGWVGPRAGLDTEAAGKISCFCRGSNLDRLVVQPVARHYTDWATRITDYGLLLPKFQALRKTFTSLKNPLLRGCIMYGHRCWTTGPRLLELGQTCSLPAGFLLTRSNQHRGRWGVRLKPQARGLGAIYYRH